MKIALVQAPNVQRSGVWKSLGVSRPPINLALLAAYVRQFGHEPVVYDLDWFEGSIEIAAKLILASNANFIGFTCLSPRLAITLKIAQRIKEFNPDVKIVMGGSHVNAVKEQALYPCIDYAIYGEGEEPLAELLNDYPLDKIWNLIYREGTAIVVNTKRPFMQDLDSLPFPAWDLLNLPAYEDSLTFSGTHMGVMTTRGCPWDCLFCSSGVTWGRRVRYRSVSCVLEELSQIVALGIHNIMFYDDTFTVDKKRFLEIARGMSRLDLNYYCQLRVDTVDEEVAEALALSGCIGAAVGAESGNQGIINVLRKGFTKTQVRSAVSLLKKSNVPVVASFILGSPGDTHATIRETLDFAGELDADQSKFMICTPYPGTALFDLAVLRGILTNDATPTQYSEASYYGHVTANMSRVPDDALLEYQRKAYEMFPQRKLRRKEYVTNSSG